MKLTIFRKWLFSLYILKRGLIKENLLSSLCWFVLSIFIMVIKSKRIISKERRSSDGFHDPSLTDFALLFNIGLLFSEIKFSAIFQFHTLAISGTISFQGMVAWIVSSLATIRFQIYSARFHHSSSYDLSIKSVETEILKASIVQFAED